MSLFRPADGFPDIQKPQNGFLVVSGLRWMYPFPCPIHIHVLRLHPFQILSHLFVHMLVSISKGAINASA
jgi:hypothetical protein